MTPILSYLIKANIVLVVLYGFYFLCFRRDTFYGHIRWYFLTTIASALIFPLIDISSRLTGTPAAISVSQYIPNVDAVYQYVSVQPQILQLPQIEYDIAESVISSTLPFGLILLWSWLLVAGFMLGKRLFQLACIVRLWYRYPRQRHENSAVIAVDSNIQPFSFFGRIVLNPALYSKDESEEIIAHEQIHCRQGHSIDNLLAEAIVCLFWFNPVVWLLRRDLKQNLEYHTDRMTLLRGFDSKHYQYSLLRVAGNVFQIVNHFYFNHFNHLKNRIIMLNKKESPQIMTAKYLLVVPALAVALLAVQASGLQAVEESLVNSVFTLVEQTELSENKIIEDVFVNSKDFVNKKNKMNVETVTDTVLTKKEDKTSIVLYGDPLVVVSPDRKIIAFRARDSVSFSWNLSPKEVSTNTKEKDLGSQNLQDPVKLETIPDYRKRQGTTYTPEGNIVPLVTIISIAPQEDIFDTEIHSKNLIKIRETGLIANKPLFFVDGKEVDDYYKIDPNTIESISVLKDQLAMALYGEKAKDGVILVTTKKGVILPAQALSKGELTIQVSGTVTNAKDGQPMPGVAIVMKGSNTGSVTDLSGKYSLLVPSNAILQFSFPGMATQEIVVGNQRVIDVVMSEDDDRVVMTGIKESHSDGHIISIKPLNSNTDVQPLYIVDGKEVDNLSSIDPKSIESMSILKDQSATALYAEKGKNGVVIITLKK